MAVTPDMTTGGSGMLLAVVLMLLLLAGFTVYVMGVSSRANALSSGVLSILAFAFLVPAYYLLGWWLYLAMPGGLDPVEPAVTRLLGPDLDNPDNGLRWAANTLFACVAAAIFSGAVMERIRVSAFIVLSLVLGSVVFSIAAAWAWHPQAWLISAWGYRDAALAGPLHVVSAGFAFGVLANLGQRQSKRTAAGQAVDLDPHNMPLTVVGQLLIVAGMIGLVTACYLLSRTGDAGLGFGSRATLSAYVMNALMSIAGGIIGCYFMTKNPFWMMRGALGGLVLASAGLDLWYPPLAFALGFVGGLGIPVGMRFVERLGLDDAVGAVSVHGVCGFGGIIALGLLASGYPAADGVPVSSLKGQLVGAIVMLLLGVISGFVLSFLLRVAGLLRVPAPVLALGIDRIEVAAAAYPPDPLGVAHADQPGTEDDSGGDST